MSPDLDAVKALSTMNNCGSGRLMVTEGDHLLGVLALKDLMGMLAAKLDLEGRDLGHDHAAHP